MNDLNEKRARLRKLEREVIKEIAYIHGIKDIRSYSFHLDDGKIQYVMINDVRYELYEGTA